MTHSRQHRAAARDAGYTLLELLVVMVVMGLLIAIATPQAMKLLGGAKHDAARLQIESLSQSVNFYQLDVGAYPTAEQSLRALWLKPEGISQWRGPYIRKEAQLIDPWGRPYLYAIPGANAPFEIRTLGADGREGGEGDDADISSAG